MPTIYQIADGEPTRDTWAPTKERATRRAKERSRERPAATIRIRACEIDEDLALRAAICAALNGTLITASKEVATFRRGLDVTPRALTLARGQEPEGARP